MRRLGLGAVSLLVGAGSGGVAGVLAGAAATATTTVVIALGLIRRLFTPDHRLVYLPAPADH